MPVSTEKLLKYEDWSKQAVSHRQLVQQWTQPFRKRRDERKVHPVYDFLFIYYKFPPTLLEAWHPGLELTVECPKEADPALLENFSDRFYSKEGDTRYLDLGKLDGKARKRLKWSLDLCVAVHDRLPNYGCFGMHEWAMVYHGGRDGTIRHEKSYPLRLSREEIDAVVDSRPISCTHFDAVRFFSRDALPLNRVQPSLEGRIENEQAGCLHTNMDLYKWAANAMPWVGSSLLLECFQLALAARELDMCASPYDLTNLGYGSIRIETAEGRLEYERQQRELSEAARSLRQRLITALQEIK